MASSSASANSLIFQGHTALAIPAAEGYLLVDPKKCQGCLSCMMACSLVHHGSVNLSLARIQVTHNHLANFPDDAIIAICRQCVDPLCMKACPEGALHVDSGHGNVRTVDAENCIGCGECVRACPFPIARSVWNHEAGLAEKCDLCANTPFWKETGGPAGKKACIGICPLHAIGFTDKAPIQEGDSGYLVNLRGKAWEQFGLTTD